MLDVKGFLVDLGGVVYQEGKSIPGSIEAIIQLREAGIPFRFLTNTTSKPKSSILKNLRSIGIPVESHEIFTPAVAARAYVVDHDLKPHFFISPQLREDFRDIHTGTIPAVIVGDAGDGFTYQNMNLAFRRLEAGAELIALANNRKFVDDSGKMSL